MQSQFASLNSELQSLASQSTITREQLDAVIAKRNAFGKNAFEGGGLFGQLLNNGRLAFGDEVTAVDEILTRLQKLSTLPSTDTSQQQLQLQRFEDVLRSNPAGQFQGAANAIGSAASASDRVAASWERAAVASQMVGNFDPQARSLNATPIRQGTSSVTNNSSTVNIDGITVNGQTAVRVRDLVREINRESRRGSSRIA